MLISKQLIMHAHLILLVLSNSFINSESMGGSLAASRSSAWFFSSCIFHLILVCGSWRQWWYTVGNDDWLTFNSLLARYLRGLILSIQRCLRRIFKAQLFCSLLLTLLSISSSCLILRYLLKLFHLLLRAYQILIHVALLCHKGVNWPFLVSLWHFLPSSCQPLLTKFRLSWLGIINATMRNDYTSCIY